MINCRNKSYIAIAAFVGALTISSSCSAQCNEQALAADLQRKWGPRLRAGTGTCDTATAQIGMLRDAKQAYRQCLQGKSLQDALAALDANINKWQQTKQQVCG
jgi:fatty acid-binding protein DegV